MTEPAPAPLCRYCGKPIRKVTDLLYCYPEPPRTESTDPYSGRVSKLTVLRHRVGVFRSKAELQAVINEQIVAIRRNEDGTIYSASTWDRVSYADAFFCTESHAGLFGRLYAGGGAATKAYNDAVAHPPRKGT